MAWSLTELYEKSSSTDFNNRVQMAFLKTAVDVQNESEQVENHEDRLALASQVINGTGLPTRTVAMLALRNPALQVESPTDSDILFTVSQQWNYFAGVI